MIVQQRKFFISSVLNINFSVGKNSSTLISCASLLNRNLNLSVYTYSFGVYIQLFRYYLIFKWDILIYFNFSLQINNHIFQTHVLMMFIIYN